MRNLMVGTKYLEHVGKMTIENVNGRDRCVLEFKQTVIGVRPTWFPVQFTMLQVTLLRS